MRLASQQASKGSNIAPPRSRWGRKCTFSRVKHTSEFALVQRAVGHQSDAQILASLKQTRVQRLPLQYAELHLHVKSAMRPDSSAGWIPDTAHDWF